MYLCLGKTSGLAITKQPNYYEIDDVTHTSPKDRLSDLFVSVVIWSSRGLDFWLYYGGLAGLFYLLPCLETGPDIYE